MPTRLPIASWLLAALLSWSLPLAAVEPPADPAPPAAEAHQQAHPPAAKQRGKASYYSRKFAGRKMADGTPMDPEAETAASRTLPLGSKAEVKNLQTGKSTVVEIRDRGPHAKGRIIDLSPKAAEKLGMKGKGVVPVEVTPIEIPPPRGAPAGGR